MAIVSGNHLQHQRHIRHRACHRTDVIERPAQREDAVTTHPPIGRFQPYDATERRWNPDRAPGIRAQRGKTESRRHRSRRATTRSSWHPQRVPRISAGADQ